MHVMRFSIYGIQHRGNQAKLMLYVRNSVEAVVETKPQHDCGICNHLQLEEVKIIIDPCFSL